MTEACDSLCSLSNQVCCSNGYGCCDDLDNVINNTINQATSLGIGVIIAIIASGVAVFIGCIVCCVCCCCKRAGNSGYVPAPNNTVTVVHQQTAQAPPPTQVYTDRAMHPNAQMQPPNMQMQHTNMQMQPPNMQMQPPNMHMQPPAYPGEKI